jgi:Tol biopolymer transport system component
MKKYIIFVLCALTLLRCTPDVDPEYSYFITVEEAKYNTVAQGEDIWTTLVPFLNLDVDLMMGPVPYESGELIQWSSSNSSRATVTGSSANTARVHGVKPGFVTISAQRSGSGDAINILVISKLEQALTPASGTRDEVQWSPDGTQLAYGYNGQICTVPTTGNSHPDNILTPGTRYSHQPQWSPDGSRIAFLGDDNRLWLVSSTGGDITVLTSISAGNHQWSPNGNSIAFCHGSMLYLADPLGGAEQAITSSKGSFGYEITPCWSPDGSRIVYNYQEKIYIVDVASRTEQKIIEATTPNGWNMREFPQWSADGQTLYYTDYTSLYALPVNGGPETRLLDSPTNSIEDARISPDGKYILFYDYVSLLMVISCDDLSLYRLNEPSDTYLLVGNFSKPQWSPDGSRIAFARYSDYLNSRIYVINGMPSLTP